MPKYLTPEGLEKFKKELDYLENVKRKEIAKALEVASQQGDLSENAGYDTAKEEQGFVEGKIMELRRIIAQARVIKKTKSGKVQLGSVVRLKSEVGEEKFQIVGSEEVDIAKGKISSKSPLGRQLLGKKKGDEVIIETPEGKIKYKIIGFE